MDRVRVSAIQYFIRPVDSFERFAEQVASQLATAADYGSRLIVFPEYFTTQLLSLGDPRRPMPEQVRELAGYVPRFVELMPAWPASTTCTWWREPSPTGETPTPRTAPPIPT